MQSAPISQKRDMPHPRRPVQIRLNVAIAAAKRRIGYLGILGLGRFMKRQSSGWGTWFNDVGSPEMVADEDRAS